MKLGEQQIEKKEQILEGALRRFSYFGVQKTSLTEIAEDLAITKQSLLYYYPDKQSLVVAVEGKIMDEYIGAVKEAFAAGSKVEQALHKLIDVRKDFFKKYFQLALQSETMTVTSQHPMAELKQIIRANELQLLVELFQNGIETNELRELDAEKTGGLMLDALSAMNHCMKSKSMIPDDDLVEEVFEKQHQLLDMIYNGLKRN